jgi:hypothetical protein
MENPAPKFSRAYKKRENLNLSEAFGDETFIDKSENHSDAFTLVFNKASKIGLVLVIDRGIWLVSHPQLKWTTHCSSTSCLDLTMPSFTLKA